MKELIKNLKFTWKYAKEQKMFIVLFIIFNLIRAGVSIVFPILSAKIIIALTSDNYKQIIFVAICLLMSNLINNLIDYLARRCSMIIYSKTISKLETDLGRNILKLENKTLDANGSGVFIQRLTGDTFKVSDAINAILDMSSGIIKYFGIFVAIFITNKIVFIFSVVSFITYYFLERTRTKKRNEGNKIYYKKRENVSGFVSELVRGARDIKMLNSEKDFIKELDNRVKDTNNFDIQIHKTNKRYRLLSFSIYDTFSFILIILLVILMQKNIIVPSIALVLYNYFSNSLNGTHIIGDLLDYIKDFNLSCERVSDIISGKEFTKEKFGKKHLDIVNGDFEFKNVEFSYDEKIILKNLNFKIKANETVAFVGKSGAGKTTIFNLLCKMYDVNKGSITIDGVDIQELDKETIRGNITIISQNPYIFNMSIKDNLRLVKSDLTDEEMKEACHLACLDEFIAEMEDRYDTIIGEGGVNLSGGQKQRLAIARALVQKTEIILFDEATSALDNETQMKIQEAINNMKNEYTILIIAHRLSTIINADRIMFLDDGRIIAKGTHEELLKTCPEYKKLYQSEITKED